MKEIVFFNYIFWEGMKKLELVCVKYTDLRMNMKKVRKFHSSRWFSALS